MTRLCVIGNSHIVSLRDGWESVSGEFPGVEATFFGAPVWLMRRLQRSGSELVAGTPELAERFASSSGGHSSIAGSYDAYIVYGLALSPAALSGLWEAYRSLDYAADGRALLSRRCHHQAVLALLTATPAGRTLTMLSRATRAPILLLAAPMRSDEDPAYLEAPIGNGDDRALNDSFLAGCRDLAHKNGARFAQQPQATLGACPLTTLRRFALGAGLTGPKTEGDLIHMTGEYGALLLRQVFADFLKAGAGARTSSRSPHTPRSSAG
jgi:hypothetical protein